MVHDRKLSTHYSLGCTKGELIWTLANALCDPLLRASHKATVKATVRLDDAPEVQLKRLPSSHDC